VVIFIYQCCRIKNLNQKWIYTSHIVFVPHYCIQIFVFLLHLNTKLCIKFFLAIVLPAVSYYQFFLLFSAARGETGRTL
jgi:hypothetical protein